MSPRKWKAKSFSVYRVFQDCPIAREFENLLTQPMDIQPRDICKYYEDILLQAYKTNIKKKTFCCRLVNKNGFTTTVHFTTSANGHRLKQRCRGWKESCKDAQT